MKIKVLAAVALCILMALPAHAQKKAKYATIEVEDGGSLTGTISFGGTAAAKTIAVGKDKAVCHDSVPDETVVVGEGGALANVVITFTGIEEGKDPASMPEAVLANEECRYVPHVQAVMTGQFLHVTNEDPILHNTHTYIGGDKTVFNLALPVQGQKIKKKMKRPGVLNAKCDAGHTWMDAYVVVTENPYYAVTDESGQFEITDIPEGDYTVKVWHESLGEAEFEVSISEGEAAKLDHSFGG
jgi:plastocyanin